MNYSLNLERISVQEYKTLLIQQNLLPGRRVLLQDIDRIFTEIERGGISSVAQLKKCLSAPARFEALATAGEIPKEYLVILKREIGSLDQKPIPLSSFPGVDPILLEKLSGAGITTSKEYWQSPTNLSAELYFLCDLVRINGVGPVAARAFYEAGFQSVSEVAAAEAEDMLERISAVNQAQNYYKAKLGPKDMQFCIDFARLLEKFDS